MEVRSVLLSMLVAYYSFEAATSNKSKNKADMQRVQTVCLCTKHTYMYTHTSSRAQKLDVPSGALGGLPPG